ncbi:hypothetical protein ACWEN6_29960 [Sphaerisporangium sp. NPDC004334]
MPDDVLHAVFSLASAAPSNTNTQPWKPPAGCAPPGSHLRRRLIW